MERKQPHRTSAINAFQFLESARSPPFSRQAPKTMNSIIHYTNIMRTSYNRKHLIPGKVHSFRRSTPPHLCPSQRLSGDGDVLALRAPAAHLANLDFVDSTLS